MSSIESHSGYPAIPVAEAPKPSVETLPNVRSVETIHGQKREIHGAIPEDSGVIADIKFGSEAGNELKIIDMSAIEVVDDDGENVLVSILGEEQVISKDTKFLVIGQGKELDDSGLPTLVQLEVKGGDTILGRNASPDFNFSDNVSRDHATLRVDSDGKLEFIDHSLNGSSLEFTQTPEAAAEDAAKKDGEAVLRASGVIPPSGSRPVRTALGSAEPPAPHSIDERIDEAAKSHLQKRSYQARELKEVRALERESAKLVAEANILTSQAALKDAKKDRATARLTHNRFTQYLRRHELRGEYERKVQDRIDAGDLKDKSKRTQKKYIKGARELAKSDARQERVQARTHANAEVFRARGDISRHKAERRDLSKWRRKGARNTYFENRAIVHGGFSLGEVSTDGMTAEQKKKLEERMKARLHTTRVTAHSTRGRSSTHEGARAPR